MIKEVGWQLGTVQFASVVTNIEDFGGDIEEEGEIAYDTVRNVSFPRGWKTTHDDYKLLGRR